MVDHEIWSILLEYLIIYGGYYHSYTNLTMFVWQDFDIDFEGNVCMFFHKTRKLIREESFYDSLF